MSSLLRKFDVASRKELAEHAAQTAAKFVARLLSACPNVRVLTTSRERLGIAGERLLAIEPLPVKSEAVTLFRHRAEAVSPGFEVDTAIVSRLCARLDGLPLAIELAAARSATLGTSGLLAAVDDSPRLLTGGRGADERHESLRAVLPARHVRDHRHPLHSRFRRVAGRRLVRRDIRREPAPDRRTGGRRLTPRGRTVAYALASAAELAAVAGLDDAAERIEAAAESTAHCRWATACLARAKGRLHGDLDSLTTAAAIWERIGARVELAHTLLLIPDRAAEGRALLAELGIVEGLINRG